MSKRHQASRRKSYGRRQHEVRERIERRQLPTIAESIPDTFETGVDFDDHALFGLGMGVRRLGFALGD